MRRFIWLLGRARAGARLSAAVRDAVPAAARRAGPAGCDRRPRPGTSSAAMPGRCRSAMPCSSASAPMPRWWSIPISAGRRSPARRSACSLRVLIAAVIGVPTLRLSGHYFSMATIAVAELVRVLIVDQLGIPRRRAVGLGGPAVPRTVFDLSFISALPSITICSSPCSPSLLGMTWWMSAAAWASTCAPSRIPNARRARSASRPAATSSMPTC